MLDVLGGFLLLGTVVGVGYVLGRWEVLGQDAEVPLSRLSFAVAAPALLFTTLYDAEVGAVMSPASGVAVVTATLTAVLYVVVARSVLGRPGAETVIGAMCASYVNTNNLGIPLLILVVGSAAPVAPLLLFQVLVMLPVGLTALDLLTSGKGSGWRVLLGPVRNPYVLAVTLGLGVSLVGWNPPRVLLDPLELLGAAAVPLMLLAFGISLHGAPAPGRGPGRDAVLLAVTLKSLIAPALALGIGAGVLGLAGSELLTAMVLVSLPTAQNIFVHAVRYSTSVPLARDSILLTTALSLPVILLASALVSA
ncbi:AEC family transporter [uncultured Serinicoccus sp.]|uniref:AEC family transporter n=1 Tax=uncultured Serinicoccus sp. TaxID=735514 RepID=UPI00261BA0C8|nr:AEC family transporter [uncultured Serinicoccus sp.]